MKLTKSQLKKIIEEELKEMHGARIPLGIGVPAPEEPEEEDPFTSKDKDPAVKGLWAKLKNLHPEQRSIRLSKEEASLAANIIAAYLAEPAA
jgi:hypothetical protein